MKEVQFKHYPTRPKRLTASFVKKEYAKLLLASEAAEKAQSPQLWLELFNNWNALKSYIGSEGSRISFKYSKDMSNARAEKDDIYFREKISPVVASPEHTLVEALLNSQHKDAVAEKYGRQLLVDYRISLKPLNPINTPLRVEASKITTEYEKAVAKAEIDFGGKKINLSRARALLFSADKGTRKEVYLKIGDWVLSNREELAGYYNSLVPLRHKMAKNLSYKNYIPFAYELAGRTDYGERNVELFRKLILKYTVPLYKKYAGSQAKSLEQPSLWPWDLNYHPDLSLPLGIVPVKQQLDKTKILFEKLSPKLAAHFKHMQRQSLIDLETRPNKQAGAYCTSFEDEGRVAIFCNSTGDPEDVRVLTHEMGHAFQGWESQHIEAVELQWGTAELAEIFSMGMEFLSLPYIEAYFTKQQASRFTKHRWAESLFTLCYVAVVDEFQHWVYQNPKVSPAGRDERWAEIYDKYLGVIDFKGIEKYKATRWYLQSHIFVLPFYYIDYALAEICAMQLAFEATTDHEKVFSTYLKMCKIGGTKSFLEAIEFGGLRSPFNEKLFEETMNYTAAKLKL